MYSVKRFSNNPIITPIAEHPWEAQATFNPGAVCIGGKTHILYRAMSNDNVSTLGYASSIDGVNITERLEYPVYIPREEFEVKKLPTGNSGCEDPRLTVIGDRIYMCYTAYDGVVPPRVAVSSISVVDFLAHNWNWERPRLLTAPGFDEKDACIFPEKFSQGYLVLHRVNKVICGDYLSSLDFDLCTVKKCIKIAAATENEWENYKVGIAAPPVKTKYGWLLLYHGVSKVGTVYTYSISSLLLDLEDPTIVLARGTEPIFEPQEDYEKFGIVDNVVFPCGMIMQEEDLLYIYYGGGDKVVGVAMMHVTSLVTALYDSRQH